MLALQAPRRKGNVDRSEWRPAFSKYIPLKVSLYQMCYSQVGNLEGSTGKLTEFKYKTKSQWSTSQLSVLPKCLVSFMSRPQNLEISGIPVPSLSERGLVLARVFVLAITDN